MLDAALEDSSNGFAGRPAMSGPWPHWEVRIACVADPDPIVQYVLDIKQIDAAVRTALLPPLCDAAHSGRPLAGTLRAAWPELQRQLGGLLERLTLALTPTYRMDLTRSHPDHVLLRQRFDFAASHRLHNPAISDEENRRRYGKCNNPRGHGHNYQFEPCVRVPVDAKGELPLTLHQLEHAAKLAIIDRFDHTHLNEDTVEFSIERGGVIPTVENISRVLFELLRDQLAHSCPHASLVSMTAWETDRTSATYPA